jgi:crossover junction endodeoxyribonuclease RusA
MKTLTLTGNPISTQTCYGQRGKIRYMKKEAKERKEQYQWEIKSQWREPLIEDDVTIEVHLYFGDRRRRDWDNYHKLSMDALEDIVLKDDSQIITATVTKHYDKENPRTVITIL